MMPEVRTDSKMLIQRDISELDQPSIGRGFTCLILVKYPHFSHVVIMLKKGMIVKEPARRIRYSKRVDDIRLEGHNAALFI